MRVKPLRNELKRRIIDLLKNRPNEVWYASKINRELLKAGGDYCVVTLNRALRELVDDKEIIYELNGSDLKLVEPAEPVKAGDIQVIPDATQP